MKRKHLFWIVPVVLVVAFGAWNYWPMSPVKLVVSPETTIITSPLRADGTPDYAAYLNETLSAGVTPENNAVVGLLKILGTEHIPHEHFGAVLAGLGLEDGGLPVVSMFETDDEYCDRLGITSNEDYEWYDYPDGIMDEAWTAQEHPDLAAWLASNAEALDAFAAVSHRSTFFIPAVSEEQFDRMRIIKLGNLMKVARALSVRSRGRVGEGNIDGAIDDALALHRVARICRGTLLMYLVAEGMEGSAIKAERVIVQSSNATREDLEKLQRELAALPARQTFADSFEIDHVVTIAGKVAAWQGGEVDEGGQWFPTDYSRLDINLVLREYNEAMDAYDAALGQATYQEEAAAMAAISAEMGEPENPMSGGEDEDDWSAYAWQGLFGREAYSRMVIRRELATFGPVFPKMLAKGLAVDVKTQAVAAVAAARLYEMDNGEYPADLTTLVAAGYLEAQPVDPFDGEPLRYLLTAEEVVVYSVGKNGVDDGGHDGPYGEFRECEDCEYPCEHDDLGVVLKR